jgi:hypothetical protein
MPQYIKPDNEIPYVVNYTMFPEVVCISPPPSPTIAMKTIVKIRIRNPVRI